MSNFEIQLIQNHIPDSYDYHDDDDLYTIGAVCISVSNEGLPGPSNDDDDDDDDENYNTKKSLYVRGGLQEHFTDLHSSSAIGSDGDDNLPDLPIQDFGFITFFS